MPKYAWSVRKRTLEMFAARSAGSRPFRVVYGRSSLLRERLLAALELQTIVDEPGTLVIDPDSRLTQLGLIPICDDARYFFFESRAFRRRTRYGAAGR